jgi:hypothetical protein
VDIIDWLAAQGFNVEGRLFDFFAPERMLEPLKDNQVALPPNSAVLTIGALEQTGLQWGPFLTWLLKQNPALCVHIEPVLEWYGDGLIDYTAIRAHKARNFWRGFPKALEFLKEQGRIEIIKQKRSYFGSLVLEGYSQIIWRPL